MSIYCTVPLSLPSFALGPDFAPTHFHFANGGSCCNRTDKKNGLNHGRQMPIQTRQRCNWPWARRLRASFWLSLSALMAALFTNLPAQAAVGGTPSAVPWAVQLVNLDNQRPSQVCVGAAIDEHTIVTATHCMGKVANFADRTVSVQSRHDIKGTRISVLFLTAPYVLTEYAKLGPNYLSPGQNLPPGTSGTAYGYGSDYFLAQQRVGLKVHGHGPTPASPEVIGMYTIGAGALQPGDSGAPLVIDGHLVGVLHGVAIEAPPPGSDALFVFDGLSPALDSINALVYQRKARQFVASEEL